MVRYIWKASRYWVGLIQYLAQPGKKERMNWINFEVNGYWFEISIIFIFENQQIMYQAKVSFEWQAQLK
jgi:hypothetical protein